MTGDRFGALDREGVLPLLTPVLVAREEEVDSLVQAARARNARLALELRAALHDAETAEREAGIGTRQEQVPDSSATQETLRRALEQQLSHRSLELEAELDRAQADAVTQVRAAHVEAATMVAEARDELLALLSRPSAVHREPAFRDLAAEPYGLRPQWRPTDPLVSPATLRPPPGLATPPAAPADPPIAALPPLPGAPPVPPAQPAPRMSPQRAAAFRPPPVSGPAAVLGFAPPPAAPEVALASAPMPAPQTIHAPPPPRPQRPAASLRDRYLHVDVMLPLLAVAIVIVVLLAWTA